ncbi:MAG: DUF11 domain-containing protein, partial [Bifidobacteriaceae bacterium]|nr:DUF11 domain-containing protein [Bifidobacteriaceae bacterium]
VAYDPSITGSDLVLDNTAWIRPVDVIDTTPGERVSTTTPGSDLHALKTANRDVADPGDTVSYTINLSNQRGRAAAPVTLTDWLDGVLDDAEWVSGPASSNPSVTASRQDGRIAIGGSLAGGGKADVTYTVRVRPDGARGDDTLGNAVTEGGRPGLVCAADDPLCTTTVVRSFDFAKSVDKTAARPGETVTYVLTFKNTGAADAAVDVTDQLADVLDDAALSAAPVTSTPSLSAEWDDEAGTIRVRGALPAPKGTEASVTYQVRVKPAGERGDHVLVNAVVEDPDDPPAADCAEADQTCTVTNVEDHVIRKTVDKDRLEPGEQAVYTIEFENTGALPAKIEAVDDLTGVLDDADLLEGPTSDTGSLAAAVGAPVSDETTANILMAGSVPLPPGTVARVSYTVRARAYAERGDSILRNIVMDPSQPGDTRDQARCGPTGELCTETPVVELGVAKSVDKDTLRPGETARFTITFENLGAEERSVDHHDMLAWALDDGELVEGPVSDNPAVVAGWAAEAKRIEVTGLLPAGQTAHVSYSLRVTKTGDASVDNFVIAAADPHQPFDPSGGGKPVCAPEQGMVCTVTPILPADSAASALPVTGANTIPLLPAAVLLMGAGLSALAWRRRVLGARRQTWVW